MIEHKGTRSIETARLLLRRMRESDAYDAYDRWQADADVARYMRWTPVTSLAEARKDMAEGVASYSDTRYRWGIARKEDDRVIGSISAPHIDAWDETAEVGYCLGHAFWGQGYAAEALEAVIHYLFFDVGLNRVSACHSLANPASGRVMQKAGMVREGSARQYYRAMPGLQDVDLYGIVKDMLYQPGADFAFAGPGELTDGDLALVCTKRSPAIPEKGWVPSYHFTMRANGQDVGSINLRIGMTLGLYYSGQIGYSVAEAHRGQGYAGRACRLLRPLMRHHGYREVLITNDYTNTASRRVCEKLGARLARVADVPDWHDLYTTGSHRECIWAWPVTEE